MRRARRQSRQDRFRSCRSLKPVSVGYSKGYAGCFKWSEVCPQGTQAELHCVDGLFLRREIDDPGSSAGHCLYRERHYFTGSRRGDGLPFLPGKFCQPFDDGMERPLAAFFDGLMPSSIEAKRAGEG